MGLIRGKAETKRFGLIANPIAGMGSGAGLKGTDDGMHKDAMTLGAQPVAPARTRAFLSQIRHWDRIRLLVAPAIMGGSYVDTALPTEVVEIGTIAGETSGKDTKRIAAEMLAGGADVLGSEKTLLGVDAVCNGKTVGKDLNERAILELFARFPKRKIIVTPLGGNGFVFGYKYSKVMPVEC